ncbi:MAG: ParB/RepB/Spo0J family partition protein [Bacilli bacterium]
MDSVVTIKIKDIDSFKNHPFQVNKDNSLNDLAQSIKENGLLNPLVVRKKTNGRYELISGHRRKAALELNGVEDVNVLIKELSDDEAVIYMVDSNMYREKILPSEKAFAYKMKLDAIKHQGKSICGTECHKSREIIAKNSKDGARQIQNYIRLTNLIPELLELVDNTVKYDKRTYLTMGIKPAVELSYLNKEEQKLVYSLITYEDLTPSHAQAINIRELGKKKKLNFDSLEKILMQKKGNQNDTISFNKEKIESVLPIELLKRDKRYIEQYIITAIIKYKELNQSKNNDIDLEKLNI